MPATSPVRARSDIDSWARPSVRRNALSRLNGVVGVKAASARERVLAAIPSAEIDLDFRRGCSESQDQEIVRQTPVRGAAVGVGLFARFRRRSRQMLSVAAILVGLGLLSFLGTEAWRARQAAGMTLADGLPVSTVTTSR